MLWENKKKIKCNKKKYGLQYNVGPSAFQTPFGSNRTLAIALSLWELHIVVRPTCKYFFGKRLVINTLRKNVGQRFLPLLFDT